MDVKDYYAVLGVDPDAHARTIQQAYRKLAWQYHPDVNPGNKAAEESFKVINEAYQVLSDAELRSRYDALHDQHLLRPRTSGRGEGFDWHKWAAGPGERGRVRYATVEDLGPFPAHKASSPVSSA